MTAQIVFVFMKSCCH